MNKIPSSSPIWLSRLKTTHRRRSTSGALTVEGVIRFHAWASQQQRFPSVADIVSKWECSRATAYRYRNALANAYGIVPPKAAWDGSDGVPANKHATRRKRGCVANDAIPFPVEPGA